MTRVENFYERALDEIEAIPVVSSVIFKIMRITASEFSSREDLLRCLSSDQAIAAKVLQTINSAYYGMRNPIADLNVAVGLMGDKKIRDIALLCSSSGTIRQTFPGYGITADQVWLHSVTTAFAAGFIAEKSHPDKGAAAFAAGLMHDIGKIVMDSLIRCFPGEMEVGEMASTHAWDVFPDHHEKENEAFGFDHCQIGRTLALKWNFPEVLADAIGFHHDPDALSTDNVLAHIICFADALAHTHEMGIFDSNLLELLEEEGRIPFGLSHEEVEEIYTKIGAEICDLKTFLND